MSEFDRKIQTALSTMTSSTPPARPFEDLGLPGLAPSPPKTRPSWRLAIVGSVAVLAVVLSATIVLRPGSRPPSESLTSAASGATTSVDWSMFTLSEDAGPVADVVWTGSTYIVVTDLGRMFVQEDELTWSEIDAPEGNLGSQAQLSVWEGETLVLWSEENEGHVAHSENLDNWTVSTFTLDNLPKPEEPSPFPDEEGGFVIGAATIGDELVVGFNFQYEVGPISSDGATGYQYGWQSGLWAAGPSLDAWQKIEPPYGDQSYLLHMWSTPAGLGISGTRSSMEVGPGSWTINTSSDGQTWNESDSGIVPIRNGPRRAVVSYGDAYIMTTDQFCCGTPGGGAFYHSDDGEHWEPILDDTRANGPGFDLTVGAGDLGFIIIADGVFHSTDGLMWVELDISRARTSLNGRSTRIAVGPDIVVGLGGADGQEGGLTQLLVGRTTTVSLESPTVEPN